MEKHAFNPGTTSALPRRSRRVSRFAFLTALLASSAAVNGATIYQQNFSGGLGGFTVEGTVTTGSYGARLRASLGGGAQITSSAINTSGFSNLTLSFDRSTSGLDARETAVASYSTDGTTFTTLESVRDASGRVTLSLGPDAANRSVYLRFQLNANSFFESYTVANIVLSGTNGNGNPDPDPPGGVLPPVSSVDRDGPFATTIERNTGPRRNGWVARPATLGQNGIKHPVFIWGPGAGSTPSSYEDHMRRIASHGFVVYSEVSTSNGSEIRAAIDWLVSENGRSASPYHQRLALDRIAAGGHSRGSVGTFAIASDPRLKTTIHVAGGSFDGRGPRNLRNPAIYICGEDDASATRNCERDYGNTSVPIVFTIMDNVGHIDAARAGLPAIVAWLRWHLASENARQSMFIGPRCDFCTGMWDTRSKNW